MKHIIFIFLLFSVSLNAQRFRHEIQDYSTVQKLRDEFVTPTKNDKVFVVETAKLYWYDNSDNTSIDDSLNVIVQGSYRWKCLTCDGMQSEERICLNNATPAFTPLDTNNPTTAEVQAWSTVNLTEQQRTNGTYLVYYVDGDGGDCDNPDFVWVLNKGSELITLTDKRVFNTKTVYVDAGSGSDITGKRGYRNFPFKTLNAAIGAIQDGDLLYVFPGDYITTISTDRIFNIYCENGVNWQYTVSLTSSRTLSSSTLVSWTFDNLYTNITNIGNTESPSLISNCNYGINLKINKAKYIFVHNTGTNKIFESASWHIKNSYNSHFNLSTLNNTVPNPIVNVIIDNIYKNDDLWVIQRQLSSNSVFNIDVGNIYFKSTGVPSYSNVFNISAGSDSNTSDKITNYYIKSISTDKSTPLNSYPVFTDTYTAEIGTSGNHTNTMFRTHTISNNDITSVNILNGVYRIHTVGQSFYSGGRSNNVYTYNISGVQKKGFVYYSTYSNLANSHTIYINLNVITEDHAAVYISLDGVPINSTSSIIISGSIKTTKSGYPCIVLGSNQNGRIVLKNLTLINDGSVSPILINSSTPENVTIQNVKSNSLITDPNIVEVGESIVRNTNYK